MGGWVGGRVGGWAGRGGGPGARGRRPADCGVGAKVAISSAGAGKKARDDFDDLMDFAPVVHTGTGVIGASQGRLRLLLPRGFFQGGQRAVFQGGGAGVGVRGPFNVQPRLRLPRVGNGMRGMSLPDFQNSKHTPPPKASQQRRRGRRSQIPHQPWSRLPVATAAPAWQTR